MQKRPIEVRQAMGCGYELPMTGLRPAIPWEHPGYSLYADERNEVGRDRSPVCAGYVCALPEVVEVSYAASWQRNGELTQWCEGQSTPGLREAIAILNGEYSRVESWASDNPEKK